MRKAAHVNTHAGIAVTGCHAQLAAEEIIKTGSLAANRLAIVGNDRKDLLVTHILEGKHQEDMPSDDLRTRSAEISMLPVSRFAGRTRAYLRIQDGCNSFCSYCIVPYTRGQSRSLPAGEVLEQAGKYAAAGHHEIVVTGIHVGQYGRDLNQADDIVTIMERLCNALPEIRFRLSSIEPLEISSPLLSLMKNTDNFMPHLHIPLQSGDSHILARMNRRYTSDQFLAIVQKCRAELPEAAIGIDVLVGFPGESPEHFNNTRELLERIDFSYLHVFPYSKRPGTKAAGFGDQVRKNVKAERVEALRFLSEKNRLAFYTEHIGTTRTVLLENERDRSGLLKGFTDNYIPVLIDGDDTLKNRIVTVELDFLTGDSVQANLFDKQ
ncbi:MAG: MiaB/RimO family radical SAM methylthiotransferase [Desulfocapsaceae bacterium]|nr:MiaB/RimO family radical SAM methylthiotransferase [Desulfocapsaceae bacterium]